MFASLNYFLGNVTVSEEYNKIEISGINTTSFISDFDKLWKTKSATKHMFESKSSAYISFHSFFLPDVYVTIVKLLEPNSIKKRKLSTNTLLKIKQGIINDTWIGNLNKIYPDIVDMTKTKKLVWKPLPHQNDFIDTYNEMVPKMRLNGYLLSALPGSGKTFASIALSEALMSTLAIFIVPKNSVEKVWRATILAQYGEDVSYWTSLDGTPPIPNKKIYVFHYEALEKALEFFKKTSFHAKKKIFICVDECHNFNELKSNRTKTLIGLHDTIRLSNLSSQNVYSVWMSGTPFKALGKEIIPFLKANDPLFTPECETRFIKIFGTKSARGLDILAHRVGKLSFSVPKSVLGLPDPIVEEIKVTVPNSDIFLLETIAADMKEYVATRHAYYSEIEDTIKSDFERLILLHKNTCVSEKDLSEFKTYDTYVRNIRKFFDPKTMSEMSSFCKKYEKDILIPSLKDKANKSLFKYIIAKYKYIKLVIMGECLANVLGKRKIACYVAISEVAPIPEIVSDALKKTIIFSSSKQAVDSVSMRLNDIGFDPVVIHGDTNKNLKGLLSEFEQIKERNPLAATVQSLSTAVPITVANTVIFINQPYREYIREQAIARVNRLGQNTQCYVYDLILDTGSKSNVTMRDKEILKWASDQVALIMGESLSNAENSALLNCISDPTSPVEKIKTLFSSYFS